jgi:Family of unknown function (DUF5989)
MSKKSQDAARRINNKQPKAGAAGLGDANRDFELQANLPQAGFIAELRYMIMQNKAWWLVPILLMLVLLSVVVFLGGTAAAPFIYTLF